MRKNTVVGIYLGEDERNRLERIRFRLNSRTLSNTMRCLINAYYMQCIMGKENINDNTIIERPTTTTR